MLGVEVSEDERTLVGVRGNDDAGVYKLTEEIALIQTLDFITPIVDDPYIFGQIAACNSLSDVYAMGGKPLTALNIVGFPTKKFSLNILTEILRGGVDILKKAGVQLLGGHSVEDEELKYGLSVTGTIHPAKIIKNRGLQDGDSIILTKALGTGIIGTAVKADMADDTILIPYINSMRTLNDKASFIMQKYTVHACTDVTGFGLAGHLKEMISDDKVSVSIFSKNLPLLPGVKENALMGLLPAGLYRNREHIGDMFKEKKDISQEYIDVLFDPQTSGGFLIAVPQEEGKNLLNELHKNGLSNSDIIAKVDSSQERKIKLE